MGRLCRRGILIDLILIVALSVFAWASLLSPDYFLGASDAPHSIFFLVEFDQGIKDGYLIPRWGTDHAWGYGYPTFIFYSPLAYYVAEVFHLLGAGPTTAVKITYTLAFILSGWAMYAFVKRLFGREAGLVAAIVYIYTPYHLVDIYVRCAFSEFCAFVFLPLVLWSFLELVESGRIRWVAWAALSYAGLILTHNATAFLFTPFLGVYILFLLLKQMSEARYRIPCALSSGSYPLSNKVRVGLVVGALVLALTLSAFFMLPMFSEMGYIKLEQWTRATYSYGEHFLYPSQLFSHFWDWGYSVKGPEDTMSFQLGLMPVLLSVMASLVALWCGSQQIRCASADQGIDSESTDEMTEGCLHGREREARSHVVFFLAMTLAVVLAMTPLSLPLWQALPIASLVQFPWRLLALTTVTLSVLSGAVLRAEGKREGIREGRQDAEDATWNGNALSPVACVLLLTIVFASLKYARPEYTPPSARSETPLGVLDHEMAHTDMIGMTAWTQEKPRTSPLVDQYLAGKPLIKAHILRAEPQDEALREEGSVEMVRHGGGSEEVVVRAPQDVTVQFYTYYYPGWRGYVDGKETAIRPEETLGLIALDVPAGEHRVVIRFGDIPVRVAGKMLSVLGVLMVTLLLFRP